MTDGSQESRSNGIGDTKIGENSSPQANLFFLLFLVLLFLLFLTLPVHSNTAESARL